VIDLFWKFANARLSLLKEGSTDDPILQKHRFTNCYRACDRVSQYLIRHVIQSEELFDAESILLRVLLFRIFNRIDTWEYLEKEFSRLDMSIEWRTWSSSAVEWLLRKRVSAGYPVFTGVYRITSKDCYDRGTKYGNYVGCIDEIMLRSHGIIATTSLRAVFEQLLDVPLIGPFLSMQLCTDLGYAGYPWSENDFIYPGPGCRRGVSKTFGVAFGDVEAIMSKVAEVTEAAPKHFPGLELPATTKSASKVHSLSLMDVQNLFCEFDKYLRISHPDVRVVGFGMRRVAKRPKQQYAPARDDNGELRSPLSWPDSYTFPEGWYVT
jgi:hypothetical protein